MHRVVLLTAVLSLFSSLYSAPVEFVAVVNSVTESDDATILTVGITPDSSVEVRVTGLTEIKNEDGFPVSVDEIVPGQNVEIEALFTDIGLLALEIKIRGEENEFELKGVISEMTAPGEIMVQGFQILVPDTARIRDQNRQAITFDDLSVGLSVKVTGVSEGTALVAHSIKVLSQLRDYARISFDGVLSNFVTADETQFLVTIEGGVEVLVEINTETRVRGELREGAFISVSGIINSGLFVTALRIHVKELIELSPEELEMAPEETATVTVVLRVPLEEELVLAIASDDPGIASPSPAELHIPAGELSAGFDVTSGPGPGRCRISAALPAEYGGGAKVLKVKVGDGSDEENDEGSDDEKDDGSGEEKELDVKWTPRVIKAAPNSSRQVDLHLKHGPVETDTPVALSLVEGPEDLVSFPDSVTIPAGSTHVRITLLFSGQAGKAILEARLPDEMGSSRDLLKIEIAAPVKSLRIGWSPSSMKLRPDAEGSVLLVLSREAPADVPVAITVKEGVQDALRSDEGYPLA